MDEEIQTIRIRVEGEKIELLRQLQSEIEIIEGVQTEFHRQEEEREETGLSGGTGLEDQAPTIIEYIAGYLTVKYVDGAVSDMGASHGEIVRMRIQQYLDNDNNSEVNIEDMESDSGDIDT